MSLNLLKSLWYFSTFPQRSVMIQIMYPQDQPENSIQCYDKKEDMRGTVAIERYWGDDLGKKEEVVVESIAAEETRGLANWLNVWCKLKS